jgi:hypothetical protein
MWDGFLINGDPFAADLVLESEQTTTVPLPRVPGQPDWLSLFLKVKIDLVVQRSSRLLVVDHKSQAKVTSPDTLSRDMDMDDQLGLYLYAMRLVSGKPASRLSACWSYAVTTDLKKEPRPPDARFWLSWSARTDHELDAIGREASQSALDAYRRPAYIEPPRHPDKEVCRWRCSHRDAGYHARSSGRAVELVEPYRPDQLPDGHN